MKKYSWIVALLLALSFTAFFIGCGVDPVEVPEPVEETFTEVKLGAFNIWAGGKDQQRGWATGAGFKFLGVGDKMETAKDGGYKVEDFRKAKYLELELNEGHPKGGVQIIWGASEGNAEGISGWNSNALTSDAGAITAGKGATLVGSTLKIELSKALTDYAKYKIAPEVKILIQYYTGAGVADLVKSAKLLIPDAEAPFVAVTGMALEKSQFSWAGELKLKGIFTPEDATNQLVTWSIKSWTPKGGGASTTLSIKGKPDGTNVEKADYLASKTALLDKVAFKVEKKVIFPEVVEWDYSVLPPEKVTLYGGETESWRSEDTIVATDGVDSIGTVVIVATVTDGKADGDYTQEFTVTIVDPYIFTGTFNKVFNLPDGKDIITGALTPIAANGSFSDLVLDPLPKSAYGGYKLDKCTGADASGWHNGGYYVYFRASFPEGKKLSDYALLNFRAVGTDSNWKDVSIYATAAAPTGNVKWEDGSWVKDNWVRLGPKNGLSQYDNPQDVQVRNDEIRSLEVVFNDKIKDSAVDINNPYITIYYHAQFNHGYEACDFVFDPK